MTKFRDYPVLSMNTLAAVALAVPGIVALWHLGWFVLTFWPKVIEHVAGSIR